MRFKVSKSVKAVVILATVFALSLPQSVSAIYFFNDLSPAEKLKPAEPAVGFAIRDDRVLTQISGINGATKGTYTTNLVCETVLDPKCAEASNLRVMAVLPPCAPDAALTDVCIKAVRTGDSSGKLQDAKLQYEINTFKFPKNSKYNLPAGGGISVWRGQTIKGTELDFSVAVDLQINFNAKQVGKGGSGTIGNSPNGYESDVIGFSAQIIPTKVLNGNYYPAKWDATKSSGNPMGYAGERLDNPGNGPEDQYRDCIWHDLGRCGMPETFFGDQPIELVLQMDSQVSGWLFGRMKNVIASSKPLSKTTSLISVSGQSINVPSGVSWIPVGEFKNSLGLKEMNWDNRVDQASGQIRWVQPSNHPDLFEFPTFGKPPENGGGVHKPDPKLKDAGGYLQAAEKWLKTSDGTPTWRFQGMDPSSFWGMDQSQGNKVFECTVKDTSKLHGVMTTNAMAYSWSPPSFKNGVLSYKVAGAHHDVDGSVFKGTYDLAMNQESAKCIYGFNDAPIKASVSVVSSDGGVQEIATEMLTVKNGWLQLSAKNFTFSAPTIRIKLTQDQAVKPVENSSSTQRKDESKVSAPAVTAKKIKVINCVKGKLTRKISGVNPKCPSGFKAKV